LKNRIFKGIGSNAFGVISTVIVQVLGVPVYLKYWGFELYGEWLILSTIPTYLMLSDIGFGNVAANEMTILVAKGERDKALTVFQSTLSLVTIISSIAITILSILFWVLPIDKYLNIHNLSHTESATILTLLTLSVISALQINLASAAFRCEGEYALGSLYYSVIRLFSFFTVILSIIYGLKPYHCAWGFLISNYLGTLVMVAHLCWKHKWIRYNFKNSNLSTIKTMLKPAIAFMYFPIGDALNLQGTVLIIGIILGARSVVVFSTLRTLSRMGLLFVQTISRAVWPEMSVAFSKGDLNLARKLHRYTFKVTLWVSFLTTICLWIVGGKVIQVWTQGKVDFDNSLFALMLILVLTGALWSSSIITSMSINKHQIIAIKYLYGTIFSLIISIPLTMKLGLNGSAISLFIVDAFMIVETIKTSLKLTNDEPKKFLKNTLQIKSL
jgi:O-antigen/teichoic acid export membrane protein